MYRKIINIVRTVARRLSSANHQKQRWFKSEAESAESGERMAYKKERLWFLFRFLHEVEQAMSKEEEKQVMIENAINLRLMCDYVVSCSYNDVVLIICMLHVYVKLLDEVKADDVFYQAYYRGVFMKMADRLAEQIEYDYEKQLEKCLKKMNAKGEKDDVGEDAMILAAKRK